MNYIIVFISVIMLSFGNIYADFIKLKNGQSASTQILDTINCDVRILRNNKSVNINKKLIDFIVMNNDTVNYNNYKCTPQKRSPDILEVQDEYLIPESQIDELQADISELKKDIALRNNPEKEMIKKRVRITFGVSQILAGVTSEVLSIREFVVTKKDYRKLNMDTKKNIKELRLNLFKFSLLSAAVTVGGIVTISF